MERERVWKKKKKKREKRIHKHLYITVSNRRESVPEKKPENKKKRPRNAMQ